MKIKSTIALLSCMLLVLGACNEKQEPENNNREEAPSFEGDEGSVEGHGWVNLGLPSGTLWAACNVGADSPEESGDYFAWGETRTKARYTEDNYKYGANLYSLTKYCNRSDLGKNGLTDTLTVLEATDDVATVKWGGHWRMPTMKEFEELYKKCSREMITRSGKKGFLFTGPNGNSIFLPVTGTFGDNLTDDVNSGYYWSASLDTNAPSNAYRFVFQSETVNSHDRTYRCYGNAVRPVVKR